MKLKAFFNRLWIDDRGQSTTEYILILSVVVMIAMKFRKEFEGRLGKITEKLGNDIESATGGSN